MLKAQDTFGPFTAIIEYIPAGAENEAGFQLTARYYPSAVLAGIPVRPTEDYAYVYLGGWPIGTLTEESLNALAGAPAGMLTLLMERRNMLLLVRAMDRSERVAYQIQAMTELIAQS